MKLVAREPETAELVQALNEDPEIVSSEIAWTEVVIATRRAGRSTARAERILDGIALVPVDGALLRDAATPGPRDLRTLDAIHLATGLSLRPDVGRMIAFDVRQAREASMLGLGVWTPGSTPGS